MGRGGALLTHRIKGPCDGGCTDYSVPMCERTVDGISSQDTCVCKSLGQGGLGDGAGSPVGCSFVSAICPWPAKGRGQQDRRAIRRGVPLVAHRNVCIPNNVP